MFVTGRTQITFAHTEVTTHKTEAHLGMKTVYYNVFHQLSHSRKPAFLTAANVSLKTNQNMYVYVKVRLLKMSTVYSLATVGGVVCYDFYSLIKCATKVTHRPLCPAPQREASVYMLRLSIVLPVPLSHLFQSQYVLPPLPSTLPDHPSLFADHTAHITTFKTSLQGETMLNY